MKRALKRALAGIAIFFVLFSGIAVAGVAVIHGMQFSRIDPTDLNDHPAIADFPGLAREKVTLQSGGNQLVGWYYPVADAKGIVVQAHGLGGTADAGLPNIAAFVADGWAVFALNNTGTAESGGKTMRGFPQGVIDLDIALRYLEGREDTRDLPLMLAGHSWGGYAVCAVLNYDHPNVKAVASLAGFNSNTENIMVSVKSMAGPLHYAIYPYFQAYNQILFGKAAFFTAVAGINRSGAHFLLLHGDADGSLDIQTNSILAHRAEITNPHAEYLVIEGGTHMSVLFDAQTNAYRDENWERLKALREEHDGDVPEHILREYYNGLDRVRSQTYDPVLMERILTLFNNAIK